MKQGVALQRAGHAAEALTVLREAVACAPAHAAAHANLGWSLQQLGQLDEAAASYRAALERNPRLAAALGNLALVLSRQERVDEAATCYRKLLSLHPEIADAHFALGTLFQRQGRTEAAARHINRGLALQPRQDQAWVILGNLMIDLGRFGDAERCFRLAEALAHDSAALDYGHGRLLFLHGHLEQAHDRLARSLARDPFNIGAYVYLGQCFLQVMLLRDAVDCYRRALALSPADAALLNDLAMTLQTDRQSSHAIIWFKRCLRADPTYARAHSNLGQANFSIGRIDEAVQNLQQALELEPQSPVAHSNLIFTLAHHDRCTPEQHAEETRRFGQMLDPYLRRNDRYVNLSDPERRLRIAFVSADLIQHAVAHFLEPVWECMDRRNFEIVAYATRAAEDQVTARLKRHAALWRTVAHLDDASLAEQVRADGIDILVDLSGHSAGNRLPMLALKPAPVQVTWLGYPGSTGLRAIDWRISDAEGDPPGVTEHLHSERLWRLPEIWNVYRPAAESPVPPPHPPADDNGFVTFGSFNKIAKLGESTVALWASLLLSAADTRLMLKAPGLESDDHRQTLLERFQRHGVAAERLILLGQAPKLQYAAYNDVDVALDPFPYNGTTTSMDALWMGVPVVALCGRHFAARAGTSLLRNAGLSELVADTPNDYLAIAGRLAGDRAYLRTVRQDLRLRVQQSPLMDAPRFTKHLQQAFRGMWREWCANRTASERA